MEDAIIISARGRSRHYGKLSGGLAPLLGVARVGALEAIHMPRVAVRPLRSSLCRFPHASPGSPSPAGKHKMVPKGRSKRLIFLKKFGAGEGIRTLDPNLGKVANLIARRALTGLSIYRPSIARSSPEANLGALRDDASHLREPTRRKIPFEKPFESVRLKRCRSAKSLISMVGAQGLEPWTR